MIVNKKIFTFLILFVNTCCFAKEFSYNNTNTGISKKSMTGDSTPAICSRSEEVEKIIDEAISLGAPIYNQGLHLACYRVYEWAAYKIIYEYAEPCKQVELILKKAINKSHGDYSDTEKAWIMRQAFDKVLGVPTQISPPAEKESPIKEKKS